MSGCQKNALARKNAQNQRFRYVSITGTFYYFWWAPYLYDGKINYERFSRQTEKNFFFTQNCKRHNARYCILSVMKEHLSNPPSIRLDYHLLVFSFRFLLSKLTVCVIEKAHFQICIQSWSARMRVHHLKVTSV